MDRDTVLTLNALNRRFYAARAADFSAARQDPWPGWEPLRQHLAGAAAPQRVLDLGCGNARLARFLRAGRVPLAYTGIDACSALLDEAAAEMEPRAGDRLLCADLVAEPPERALPAGPFELVALFGLLHHVPGRDARGRLLAAAATRLAPDGLLALNLWRFDRFPRFERRRVPWSRVPALDPARLEPGDALLAWGEGDGPPRFCHAMDDAEIDALLDPLALREVARYAGEGGLNEYRLLRAA